jgi:hypothetical protein
MLALKEIFVFKVFNNRCLTEILHTYKKDINATIVAVLLFGMAWGL